MQERRFRTVVIATEGRIRVEREELHGNSWHLVDTYKTSDIAQRPGAKDRPNGRKLRRQGCDEWIDKTVALCSQPSAGIVIEVPPVPAIEMSQAERLAAFQMCAEDFDRDAKTFEPDEKLFREQYMNDWNRDNLPSEDHDIED